MKKWLLRFVYAALVMAPIGAAADYLATAGGATTVFAFVCVASKVCPAQVPIDSTGAEKATAGNPFRVDPTGTTPQPSTQSGAWNITNVTGTVSLPTGAATAALQGTNTATSAHTCSVAGFSELGCLGQIDDDVKGPVAAGTARIGYTSDDVCTQKAKTNLPISQNGTASVQLIALSGATVIYVCSLSLIAAGATTVALTTGTGAACVTGTTAVIGSTTVANSMSLAANGGLTLGSGAGTIAQGNASSELCMVLGTNVFVAGNLTYVQQ